MSKKGAFVARRHLCWFSRRSDYKKMEVGEVFKVDPDYILWCYENLKFLRFNTAFMKKIKEYRKSKTIHSHSTPLT